MTQTRSSAEVWLLGKSTDHLSGSHLPTNGDALRLLIFLHNQQKLTLKEAAYSSVSRVIQLWQRARIPYQRIDSGVRILTKLHEDYAKLKKNRLRSNEQDKRNREEFLGRLQLLFDIATSDALITIKNEEDKQFLIKQRNDVFSCSMLGVDATLFRKEKRKLSRQQHQQEYAEKVASASTSAEQKHYIHSSSSSSSSASSEEEFEITTRCRKREPKRRRVNILDDPEVAGALDRVNVTDRGATYVVGAVANALGCNASIMTLSRSSIRRSRCRNRETQATVHEEFIHRTPLLLHWDGKLLPDISGSKKTVDRIAVLVTGGGEEMLLGVPKIGRGTGKEQAEACLTTLDEWGIRQQVCGLVFDTTASNTGLKNGACTFIEQSLDREMVWVACRHHVMELVLASTFRALFGPTGGPDVALFKRFQTSWPYIDQSTYDTASNDMFDSNTAVLRAEMMNFCKAALEESQPREDYKELINLCMIFLGAADPSEVSFRAPGAFHHARWMAKAIYSLKLFLFQHQFTLTSKEKKGVTELALFVSLVYVRFWHEAPLARKAPLNDMQLLESLTNYPNRTVAKAATDTFSRHLWYFSEILVGLSFFDERIGADVRTQMVANLQISGSDEFAKRLDNLPEPVSATGLASCVTQRTASIFDVLSLNGKTKAQQFLAKNPTEWNDDPSYQELKTAASKMKVVNDSAERAIALMQQYNSSLTKNEDQKQYVLRLVERHRKQYPTCAKSTILTGSGQRKCDVGDPGRRDNC